MIPSDKASATPRRRSFLATRQDESVAPKLFLAEAEEPDPSPLKKEDEDIPVLTEVVAAGDQREAPDFAAISEDSHVEKFAGRMIQVFEDRMARELPGLIEATLLNISEELRDGIKSTMDAALRDFSARCRQEIEDRKQ